MSVRLTLRLDFDSGRRLGPGKVALLEAVARKGSIAAAGREFAMSYRRAWLLVDELNRMFAMPLVATREGGRNGGGAVLTEAGSAIVSMYREAEQKACRTAAREIEAIEKGLAAKPVG